MRVFSGLAILCASFAINSAFAADLFIRSRRITCPEAAVSVKGPGPVGRILSINAVPTQTQGNLFAQQFVFEGSQEATMLLDLVITAEKETAVIQIVASATRLACLQEQIAKAKEVVIVTGCEARIVAMTPVPSNCNSGELTTR